MNETMNNVEKNGEMYFHPGYYVEECLKSLNISIEEFAKEINEEEPEIRLFLNGSLNINSTLAKKIANYFNTSEELWWNLQKGFNKLRRK